MSEAGFFSLAGNLWSCLFGGMSLAVTAAGVLADQMPQGSQGELSFWIVSVWVPGQVFFFLGYYFCEGFAMPRYQCMTEGCGGPEECRGLCSRCYDTAQKLVRAGQAVEEAMRRAEKCVFDQVKRIMGAS